MSLSRNTSKQARRRARRRQVLPGFPRTEKFSSIAEAHDYVSGADLQCLLCGQRKQSLGIHVLKIHDMTAEQYKVLFGIPYGVGLSSAPSRDKHVHAKRAPREVLVERAALARKTKEDYGASWRPPVSTVAAQRETRLRAMSTAPETIRPCTTCGADVTVSGSRVFYKTLRCLDCILPQSRPNQPMSDDAKVRLKEWEKTNSTRASEYNKARNWWGWQRNPLPLLAYAEKWGAKLRLMPRLLEAQAKMPSKGQGFAL